MDDDARQRSRLDLADRIHSAAIHVLRAVRPADAASGLTASRLSALSVVVFAGPLRLSALAEAEQVRAPTISRLVRALEDDGLVRRAPDPSDGRAWLVEATPAGERVLHEGRRRRVERLARALGGLGEADAAALARAVEVLEGVVGPRHEAHASPDASSRSSSSSSSRSRSR